MDRLRADLDRTPDDAGEPGRAPGSDERGRSIGCARRRVPRDREADRAALHLLELGASGGLNLCWDRYRYEAGPDRVWGSNDSGVRFVDGFDGRPPFDTRCRVVSRVGCDAKPVDVSSSEGRTTLRSYIWADQLNRLDRLDAAIAVARRIRPRVESASASTWLEKHLSRLRRRSVVVVFHSIVWQYLGRKEQRGVLRTLEAGARRARRDTALAWLRLEPANGFAALRLTLWPGGTDELLARTGYHGSPVTWLAKRSGEMENTAMPS